MYPFCVFFIVEVKVLVGALVLRAVSKGLNAPDLTFDPVVCEKSRSKVRPKKKFARVGEDHVKCPTLGEGYFISPLVKAPYRPGRGIVGDSLIDKCIKLNIQQQ